MKGRMIHRKLVMGLLLALAWGTLWGQEVYTEHFDVAGSWITTNPAAYLPTAYTNSALPINDQFSSNEALRDATNFRSAPYAWRVRNTANRYFRYECTETVTGFEVYLARWDNDPVPVVHVRYSVNSGVSYTNVDTITGNDLSADLSFERYSFNFATPVAPAAGQKIFIEFLTVSGERMLYDDFQLEYDDVQVDNPGNFDAVTYSQAQVNLSWTNNEASNPVMIAYNTDYSFGTPSGVYQAGDPIGTATVIYVGTQEDFSHTGLSAGSLYFYKAWSVTGAYDYSVGVVDSAYAMFPEPSAHPAGLSAAINNGPTTVTVSWTDSDATKYLLKGSSGGYASIAVPADGVAEADAFLVKNVNASIQQHQFTGLLPETQYFFKIFPYNGISTTIDYKTDGTVPSASATTPAFSLPLIISEVADPADSANAKFVELTNIGTQAIDFSATPVYLCRQTDGGNWGSVALTGTLAPGAAHVVAYQSARFFNAFGFYATQNSGNISGNGDDGYFLFYGGNQASGILFDAFGVIDTDGSGSGWEYTDRKAVRKRNVMAPGPVWQAAEWVISPGATGVAAMTPGLHNGSMTWAGLSSSNWNEKGANWNSPYGFIPDASSIVTIPNAPIHPALTTTTVVHQIILENGATLSIQSPAALIILGD